MLLLSPSLSSCRFLPASRRLPDDEASEIVDDAGGPFNTGGDDFYWNGEVVYEGGEVGSVEHGYC